VFYASTGPPQSGAPDRAHQNGRVNACSAWRNRSRTRAAGAGTRRAWARGQCVHPQPAAAAQPERRPFGQGRHPDLSASPLSLRLARLVQPQRARIAGGASALASAAALPLVVAHALVRQRPVDRAVRDVRSRLWGAIARWLAFEGLLYRRLRRQLRRSPPEVVHIHGWGCGEDPPGALNQLNRLGLPLVYTEHASPDPRRHQPVHDAPMNLADVLIAVSQAGRDGLRSVGGATRPIRLVPYSVDPLPKPARVTRHGDYVISCVARLSPQKRHLDLLEAYAQVRAAIPGARLLLAGIGPLEDDVRERARQLGIEPGVELLGLVTRAGLSDLLASTDVVVLASAWEGLPVALIEALAAGKPIVASDAGGNRELVRHGENGLVVPVGDVDALAHALLELGLDPAARQRMGAASLARFAQGTFSRTAVADRHLEAYRLAVKLRNGSSQTGMPDTAFGAL
jgi:glycosyltransferase involved in cell wall biosynthesis